jgi:hypothetical protein
MVGKGNLESREYLYHTLISSDKIFGICGWRKYFSADLDGKGLVLATVVADNAIRVVPQKRHGSPPAEFETSEPV